MHCMCIMNDRYLSTRFAGKKYKYAKGNPQINNYNPKQLD